MTLDWKELQIHFLDSLLRPDRIEAKRIAQYALEEGTTALDFFENCISPVLTEIGKRFETLDIFLPEMVDAADIVQEVNQQIIQPATQASGVQKLAANGKVLMATIQGDLHDIGKNMVCVLLRVSGFDVIDMGTNVNVDSIVDRAEQEKVDIIGLSSLLTSCLPYMKDVVELLEFRNIRNEHAVIIGGAAPTELFSKEINVDGYGHTSAEAVRLCTEIMQAKKNRAI
jgi:methylmalonyl-CoA mutase cobalamin-binding domain/chain